LFGGAGGHPGQSPALELPELPVSPEFELSPDPPPPPAELSENGLGLLPWQLVRFWQPCHKPPLVPPSDFCVYLGEPE
jgi:hypothetical protein